MWGMKGAKWTEAEEAKYRRLESRAMAALDERGETGLVKSRAAAEKRMRRLGLERDEAGIELAKRFLLAYSDLGVKYREAAKRVGVELVDLHAVFALWPEGKVVRDYLHDVRVELTRVEDADDLAAARQTVREAMRDAKSAGDSKAAMFMMSKLDRERFGEDVRSGADDGRSRAQVVYNLPGLTVNMIAAPEGMVRRLGKSEEEPTIDV